jgi:hypothetical protein
MKMQLKLFMSACGLALALSAALFLMAGCSTVPGQPSFQESAYAWSTNAVANARTTIVPYVPAPYNGLLEGALAVSTGLLGLWGAKLHKNVTALNGAVNKATVEPGPAKS